MMNRTIRRWTARILLLMLLLFPAAHSGMPGAAAEEETNSDAEGSRWVEYDYRKLDVGNPNPMEGKFFTLMWGGTTSDQDAQRLLHGYHLVKWDPQLGKIRFDRSVVSGGVTMDDAEGNRTYILRLQEDLKYSDGKNITAKDYAFGLLIQMLPAVQETGGQPIDASWLLGAEEYLRGEANCLKGLRLLGNHQISITVRAEALPWYFELSRLNICPYPISEIAPGHTISDAGEGVFLNSPITPEELQDHVLDEEHGYLRHPGTVSGAYKLESIDGQKAVFSRNRFYKGGEDGRKPLLETLSLTQADPSKMIQQLGDGTFGLLNKVTRAEMLQAGMDLTRQPERQYAMSNYPRSGLSLLWFNENSQKAQELAVRKAVALSLDRDAFVREYVGPYGMKVDGYYGIGQWMYQALNGNGSYDPPMSARSTEAERRARDQAVLTLKTLNLDGLTRYTLNTDMANTVLNEAGWTLDMGGGSYVPGEGDIRYKIVNDRLLRLRLVLAVPDNPELVRAMEKTFVPALAEAGIELMIRTADMKSIEDYYSGLGEGIDMVFLGENFSDVFDPEVFRTEGDSEIARMDKELYEMSLEMLRTEPGDAVEFLSRWVRLQERITETLPLIPLYSNMYFDFYTCELHDYEVARKTSWADAVLTSYMSLPNTNVSE